MNKCTLNGLQFCFPCPHLKFSSIVTGGGDGDGVKKGRVPRRENASPLDSRGELPYKNDGTARRKVLKNTLKGKYL